MIRNTILFLALFTLLAFQACLDDGGLDFPDDDGEDIVVTESIAIVSLSNALETQFLRPENACLRFVYPIDLGFNNGITITVENETGLLEAVRSQSSGFHVNSISFPFLMTSEDRLLSIENEEDLLNALGLCFIPTLRNAFDEVHKQCFNLIYPIKMINRAGEEVLIENKDDYFILYDEEGPDYQPAFQFPIEIQVFSEEEKVTINNYYDLYQALNGCDGCPEVDFTSAPIEDFRYQFTTSLSDQATSFDWYINGTKVQSGDPTHGSILDTMLLPGSYEVCLKGYSEDCVVGELYCETITVAERCPVLEYSYEHLGMNRYIFNAGLGNVTGTFEWVINDDTVKTGSIEDTELLFQFTSGFWKVCIKAKENTCSEIIKHCEEFTICPYLEFDMTQNGDIYTFTATFPEKDIIEYTWEVYAQGTTLIAFETESPEDPEKDNQFFYQTFEPGVTYNVCIATEAGCGTVTRKCLEFTVQ